MPVIPFQSFDGSALRAFTESFCHARNGKGFVLGIKELFAQCNTPYGIPELGPQADPCETLYETVTLHEVGGATNHTAVQTFPDFNITYSGTDRFAGGYFHQSAANIAASVGTHYEINLYDSLLYTNVIGLRTVDLSGPKVDIAGIEATLTALIYSVSYDAMPNPSWRIKWVGNSLATLSRTDQAIVSRPLRANHIRAWNGGGGGLFGSAYGDVGFSFGQVAIIVSRFQDSQVGPDSLWTIPVNCLGVTGASFQSGTIGAGNRVVLVEPPAIRGYTRIGQP